MNLDAVQKWLVYLNLAAGALLIASILWTKLFKVHPFFLVYLLADEAQRGLLNSYSGDNGAEQAIYMAGSGLELILITFTIREVSRVAFEPYPGLAEFLKRSSGYLAGASALVALLLAGLDTSLSYTWNHLLQHFYTLERAVYFTLLTYLLVVSVFMAWFPVRIRRNTAIFIGGFVTFFASKCAVLLLLNRSQRTSVGLSVVMLTVSLGCVVAWIVAIRRQGEEAMTVTGIRWNPVALAQLTRQLESINASLVRFVRSQPK